ncbi:MAG TPA: FUSC family protein, partial [Caulobacteraceae bacterium]|nr:FUSC family protein [Caulobacteraceae bacterium]
MSRWHVEFSPEAASLSEGLRAAAACASLATVAVVGHDPNLSWAAVMAFWTCLVDPGGPTRIRARILMTFTFGATLVAVVCAGVASLGLFPAAAALLAATLVCSFFRVYGGEAAVLSNLLVVAAVGTIARPQGDPAALLSFAGLCLLGCLWASLLSLTVWRIHPYAAARTALGQAYRRLAAMAVGLSRTYDPESDTAAWSAFARQHRGAVRQSIEDARRRILQATGGRNDQDNISVAGARLLSGLAAAETQFACLIALSDVLERAGPGDDQRRARTQRLAMLIASVMHRLDRAVSAVDGAPEPLRLAANRLTQAARSAPANVARLVAPIAAEALHIADDDLQVDFGAAVPARPVRQRPLAPLLNNLTWKSLFLRHSARVAISVTAAFLLAETFHLPYGYWMTTTVALIQQPYLSNSWIRAVERVIGSVLGGGLAALLGMVFHSELALILLMFPLAMACMSFRAVNYSLYIFFLTPLFVLILDLTHPGVTEQSIAGIRALNTVIGGAVGLAGALLLWPGSEGDRLKMALADAVERNGRLALAALSSPGDDVKPVRAARREAGLASNRADEARRRAALEIWWRRRELKAADAALAAVRRLGGAAVALWLEGAPSEDPAADLRVGE